MTTSSLVDATAPGPASGKRADVLGLLRTAARAMSVAEVAGATDLHINTARFHLDGLVEDGFAQREAEPRSVPGRPRVLYSAEGPTPGPRSYGLLSEMLTGLVSSLKDAGPAAVEAGRAWGRHLVDRAAPSQRIDAEEAVHRLERVLDAVGFRPEVSGADDNTEILLHHCPFREVAERHTDVVCAIHLGLMQGALAELHAPVEATTLQPWVTPNLCVAKLRAARAG